MSSYCDYEIEKKKLVDCGTRLVFTSCKGLDHPKTAYTSKELLIFNAYPRTDQDLIRNDYLWHLVRSPTFIEADLRHHLTGLAPSNPIAVAAFPRKLSEFLLNVTLEQMRGLVVFMLADSAQGESNEGFDTMSAEIHPSVWKDVLRCLRIEEGERILDYPVNLDAPRDVTDKADLLDSAIEEAAHETLWIAPVELVFFEPKGVYKESSAMTRDGKPFCGMEALSGSTDMVVQCREELDNCLTANRATILQSLYGDWLRLFEVYAGRYPNAEAEWRAMVTMVALVRLGRQSVWNKIDVIRSCSLRTSSFFSLLNDQVIEQAICPMTLEVETSANSDLDISFEMMNLTSEDRSDSDSGMTD